MNKCIFEAVDSELSRKPMASHGEPVDTHKSQGSQTNLGFSQPVENP